MPLRRLDLFRLDSAYQWDADEMNHIFLGAIDRHNASAVRKQGEIGMGNIIFLLFRDMNLEGNKRRRVEQIL